MRRSHREVAAVAARRLPTSHRWSVRPPEEREDGVRFAESAPWKAPLHWAVTSLENWGTVSSREGFESSAFRHGRLAQMEEHQVANLEVGRSSRPATAMAGVAQLVGGSSPRS